MRQFLIGLLTLNLCLFGCMDGDPKSPPSPAKQVQTLRDANSLSDAGVAILFDFLEKTPVQAVACVEADLTADGVAEVIVIHTSQTEQGKMTLRVLLHTQAGWVSSNDVPAPVENQRITLRDIDNKPPLEFVVMGSKGIRSGFAIYRMVNGVLTDLFDDGMDDCC